MYIHYIQEIKQQPATNHPPYQIDRDRQTDISTTPKSIRPSPHQSTVVTSHLYLHTPTITTIATGPESTVVDSTSAQSKTEKIKKGKKRKRKMLKGRHSDVLVSRREVVKKEDNDKELAVQSNNHFLFFLLLRSPPPPPTTPSSAPRKGGEGGSGQEGMVSCRDLVRGGGNPGCSVCVCEGV